MPDTIQVGTGNVDWKVYYLAENRQKRIEFAGSAGETNTVLELYEALQDHFDELNQMDDGTTMYKDTPTSFRVGIIDPGDSEPWFIDCTSVEHLTGGVLKSEAWSRTEGSAVGIVRVPVTNVDIDANDIGDEVTHSTTDSGTLLDIENVAAGATYLWIRPASTSSDDSWDATSGTITVTGSSNTATQTAAAADGESIWSNLYSIGNLQAETHLYMYQDGAQVVAYKGTDDWWTDDHIDVLIKVKEVDVLIDEGYVTVFARQYGKTYAYSITAVPTGTRTPIPLQTDPDLNNTTGYKSMAVTGATPSVWDEENWVFVGSTWATATKKGKITQVDNPGTSTPTIHYYLLGDLTDFAGSDSLKEYTGTGTGDGDGTVNGSPSSVGPAALAGLSIAHGADETYDINEDGTTELYSIVIDVSDETLANAFEWSKYITRRGDTGTGNTDGIEGEQYIGSDYRITYTTLTLTVSEGDVVTQDTSGATGTVVAHHTTDKILILRNSRGTFDTSNVIRVDGSNYVSGPHTVNTVTPVAVAPFGSFAGGKWFCAFGVVLDNVLAADNNNYELTDDTNTKVVYPTKINLSISNTKQYDSVALFRLTGSGGDIEKDTYTVDTGQSIGDTTISVDPNIAVDEPGKTAGGILFVVDVDADTEYRYRYTGWSGDDFTLFDAGDDTAEASTDENTIVCVGYFTNCLVGDIVYNTTRTAHSYIIEKTSNDQVEIWPSITNQQSGDSFAVGPLAAAITTSDKVYVPFIHAERSADGTETVSIVYDSTIYARARARNRTGSYPTKIKPFESDVTVTGDTNVPVIRTNDD